VNPPIDAIVTFDVLCDPLLMLMLLGEAETEKFGVVTVYVTVVVWIGNPVVSEPETVMVYVPAVAVDGTGIDNKVVLPEGGKVIEVGLTEAHPLGSVTVKLTVPV
jgi:hypothetical protein